MAESKKQKNITIETLAVMVAKGFNDVTSNMALKKDLDLLHVEFKQQLEPIKKQLAGIRSTVDSHTTSLDAIVKNTNDWNIEMTVMRERMDKYEKAIKLVADKLNVNIENILH